MKTRKAKQKPDQKQLLNEMVAEIREKDRERIIFFRQIGEIADRYAWKGIHGRNGSQSSKARTNGKTSANPIAILPVTENKSMVPFPNVWMAAVIRRVGIKDENKPLVDELKKEVDSDYCVALKAIQPIYLATTPIPVTDYSIDNSKNNFKEVLRVIQRNLLRCHPLIHRPAVHLRLKLNDIKLKPLLNGEYLPLEKMIESIWLEWKRATDEFKQVALSVRERILTKSRNSPTAVNRISRIDTTVCVMLSLQVQETCARLMKNVAALLESPAFVPLSVGVGCDQQNFITITHKPEDIEKSLKDLLHRIVEDVPFDANAIPSKCNLNLTVPTDVQQIFEQSIICYSSKCRHEMDFYLKECETRFGDIIRGEVAVKTNELLAAEEVSPDEIIPAIMELRLRLKQSGLLWSINPHRRLWFMNEELKNEIISRLKNEKVRLEECLLGQYRKETNRLLAELERMKRQILQPPADTTELLGRSAYLEEARNKPLNDLIASMTELKGLFVRLTDIVTYNDADVIRSSQAFFGPDEIVPLLDDGAELIAKYRRQFEDRYQEVLEKTQKDLARTKTKMKHFNNCGDWDSVEYYVKDITTMSRKVQEIQRTANWITQEEIQLKYPITSFPEIQEIMNYIDPYIRLYTSVLNWRKSLKRWLDGDFYSLNADDIENQTDEMSREMFRLQKVFRARGKQLEAGNAQSRKANEGASQMAASLKMCQRGLDDVKEFKVQLPLVAVICNPGLRERHWQDMSDLVGQDLKPNTGTTLKKLLNLGLMPFLEKFEVISGAASKEFSLERGMKSMAEEWNIVVFSTAKYRDTDTPILASVEEIQALLDDQLIKTQTMKGSPFVRPVEKQLLAWESTLLRIQQTIEEWLIVQSQWLYLDPIFSSPNIIDQMPDEAALFKSVDAIWHEVMSALVTEPNVMQTAGSVGLLEKLTHSSKLLEQINFGVNAYLDKKRLYFSRL